MPNQSQSPTGSHRQRPHSLIIPSLQRYTPSPAGLFPPACKQPSSMSSPTFPQPLPPALFLSTALEKISVQAVSTFLPPFTPRLTPLKLLGPLPPTLRKSPLMEATCHPHPDLWQHLSTASFLRWPWVPGLPSPHPLLVSLRSSQSLGPLLLY